MSDPADKQEKMVDVLNRIKVEIQQRKELAAQNRANKELTKMNATLTANTKAAQGSNVVKFPTVQELTNGFMKISPIFNNTAYSAWMKDTLESNENTARGLDKLNGQLANPQPVDPVADNTQTEYLDLIATQLKDGNSEVLQRLDGISGKLEAQVAKPPATITLLPDDTQTEYLDLIATEMKEGTSSTLQRLETISNKLAGVSGSLGRIVTGVEQVNKEGLTRLHEDSRNELASLMRIENKVGASTGAVVGQLVRMRDDDAKWREKEEMHRLEGAKDNAPPVPVADTVVPPPEPPDTGSGGGFLGGLLAMGALTALKKVIGLPMAMIRGIIPLFTSFGGIAKAFKGIGKLFKIGPLALITSVVEFCNGFINAKEILGQDSVTILDRIKAGFSELLGSFGDLVDWVLSLFGVEGDFGKKTREVFLAIVQKPFEWAQAIVDWFKNDLFAGIGLGTSLTAIPGMVADNLTASLKKLIGWIGDGITGFVDDGIKVMDSVVENMKSGFVEHIKKPFYNMVNSILDTVLNIVEKFVELIPDALGGESARQKIAEARDGWKLEDEPTETAKGQTQPEPNKPVEDKPVPEKPEPNKPVVATTKPVSPELEPTPKVEEPVPVEKPKANKPVAPSTKPVAAELEVIPEPPKPETPKGGSYADGLAAAYGGLRNDPLKNAVPARGVASQNTAAIQANKEQSVTVVAPVQQNVNNAKSTTVNNNYNSTSLEPTNRGDGSRSLWGQVQ